MNLTPQQMRAEMFKKSYENYLLRLAFTVADRDGWSAEDRYTAAAWILLQDNERLREVLIEQINSLPAPPIFMEPQP